MAKKLLTLLGLPLLLSGTVSRPAPNPYLIVLGTAQDGGYPHAGCEKSCCRGLWQRPKEHRLVTSLAVVDPRDRKWWLFEATPDFPRQLDRLWRATPETAGVLPEAIFITHAHIGHYAGLMHLGREVLGAKAVPVYALPRLTAFIAGNGPWSQLVKLKNIILRGTTPDLPVVLNDRLRVTPFLVPHRDEFSETAGLRIQGPGRSVLFIPDIDKWSRWERDICAEVASASLAFLDGTFFDEGEIPGRSMEEIPHPFMVETLAQFHSLPKAVKSRIRFIHINHTNPVLRSNSMTRKRIREAGMRLAEEGERFGL